MKKGVVSSFQGRLQREAKVSGLRDFRTPSLEAVERRRLQLWTVTLGILLLLTGAVVVLSITPAVGFARSWTWPLPVRLSTLLLAVGFAAYVVEKEFALRRLTGLLVDERVLTAALSNRLKELSALAAIGKAVNSVLGLEDVLNIILSSALELLGGKEGSIMLVEGADRLRAFAVVGNEQAHGATARFGQGVAGHVAMTREPLLLSGTVDEEMFPGLVARTHPVDSAICVPLINRGRLLGVLNISAPSDRLFSEYDLRAMALFAEHAAVSIANARLFEAEVERVAELQEVNRLKSQFVATVSHELRSPLTSILGSAITMRNIDVGQEQRDEFLGTIERQGRRLLRLIEELLLAAQLEREGAALRSTEDVDVSALAATVAHDMSVGQTPIEVVTPGPFVVVTDPDIVQRVLMNLIDNAYKHGAPPVRVEVESVGSEAILSVLDSGPGIPPRDRERIFERFTRLDATGSRPGVGLGLPIVRELLFALDGRVWAEEATNGGALFRVSLPIRARERASA
jgi:two-component system sensor histidine kinase KdpD